MGGAHSPEPGCRELASAPIMPFLRCSGQGTKPITYVHGPPTAESSSSPPPIPSSGDPGLSLGLKSWSSYDFPFFPNVHCPQPKSTSLLGAYRPCQSPQAWSLASRVLARARNSRKPQVTSRLWALIRLFPLEGSPSLQSLWSQISSNFLMQSWAGYFPSLCLSVTSCETGMIIPVSFGQGDN